MFQSLYLNKVTALRSATLLRKTLAQVLCCEACEISKSTFYYRTLLRWLLLMIDCALCKHEQINKDELKTCL